MSQPAPVLTASGTVPLDVLIPTCGRAAALAVTLAGVFAQTLAQFRLTISDQSDDAALFNSGEVRALLRALEARGIEVRLLRHLPRRGLAEQRQFLLEQSSAPYALFLDDDLILQPGVLAHMLDAIVDAGCGFVGCAVHGLSFVADRRPHQQAIELWEGAVQPERVLPGTPAWQRHELHSAANLWHVQQRLAAEGRLPCRYKIAWIGACVLFERAKLQAVGGFGFWRDLPPAHCGEDVLAQLRVMARFGGCGLLPSGVFHQELPTTVTGRDIDAPLALPIHLEVDADADDPHLVDAA